MIKQEKVFDFGKYLFDFINKKQNEVWENSEWDLKCEFCQKPTVNNPCKECSLSIKESSNMPEFILPDEADHCEYCGKVITNMYDCCEKLKEEMLKEIEKDYQEWSQTYPYCDIYGEFNE